MKHRLEIFSRTSSSRSEIVAEMPESTFSGVAGGLVRLLILMIESEQSMAMVALHDTSTLRLALFGVRLGIRA